GLVVGAVALGGLVVAGEPAFADRGQTSPDATTNVFTVHADGSVHVDIDATISNNEGCPAGYVCFFDELVLPVPTAAFNITSDGGSVRTESDTDFAQDVVVHL